MQIIQDAGRQPIQRNTVYDVINDFAEGLPEQQAPLIARANSSLLSFLTEEDGAPAKVVGGAG